MNWKISSTFLRFGYGITESVVTLPERVTLPFYACYLSIFLKVGSNDVRIFDRNNNWIVFEYRTAS